MPKPGRKDISFDSSDGRNTIQGSIFWDVEVPPFCILQISHGMCEHMGRYEDFAHWLAQNGVAVCGNDHIGHGRSAAHDADLGYFGEKGGRQYAIRDLKTMNQMARQMFPELPLVLLGHSMGSFFARKYAVEYPETIDGLILSGTGGKNPAAGAGILLARLLSATRNPRHRSSFLHNLAFGGYLKGIDNPKTPYDWISRDEDIVQAYAADPHCTFRFTVNGFHELFNALKDVSSPHWAVGVRKDMPVLMIQGDGDPVGNYGKGTAQVRDWLHGAGVKNLEYILYPGGRHEMLNETNRAEVYADVLAFLKTWWDNAAPQDAPPKA